MAQDVAPAVSSPPPRKRSFLRIVLVVVGGLFAAFVLLVAVFLGIVAMQPADYRVERTAVIDAPANVVFDEVNDFHNWDAWSPWAKLDPHAKNEFSGEPKGKGAKFSWSGNEQVGEGTMTILESNPHELVRIELHFERPFQDTNTAQFAFQPQDGKTAVTWSMFGHKNFIGKAVCMFMDMDKMLGGEFEKGLSQMKAVSEARAAGDRAEAQADEADAENKGSEGEEEPAD
ncbi:MAG TPA: SRPBCC family protein [Planctomycetaceae bacterium]|nr:SRPBCC family protein [Planctomycetaceae bacterium]